MLALSVQAIPLVNVPNVSKDFTLCFLQDAYRAIQHAKLALGQTWIAVFSAIMGISCQEFPFVSKNAPITTIWITIGVLGAILCAKNAQDHSIRIAWNALKGILLEFQINRGFFVVNAILGA